MAWTSTWTYTRGMVISVVVSLSSSLTLLSSKLTMCVIVHPGRVGSTTVYPYDNASYEPIELGASIFADNNKNMWRASDEFGFSRYAFDDLEGDTGFWDGEKFVFIVRHAPFHSAL